MNENITIVDNKDLQHFEAKLPGGEIAFMESRWHDGRFILMHTVVPENLEGKGLASSLAKYALEYAKENDLRVTVYCIFVRKYILRHPEYEYLIKFA